MTKDEREKAARRIGFAIREWLSDELDEATANVKKYAACLPDAEVYFDSAVRNRQAIEGALSVTGRLPFRIIEAALSAPSGEGSKPDAK